ncbi:MAG: 4-hydroxy-tetrahydrodipicolinate synthase [Culicoidibacterales bacterium]
MSRFIGSGVALITPFTEVGIDYEKLTELLEWHIASGTSAIIICGTTGESATMTEDEKKEVIAFTVAHVNKRIPVIAGTGANNTAQVITMSQYCEKIGVDGLLIVTPYYNKTTDDGLYQHYKVIAQSVTLPIILYNVPSRTGMNMNPQVVVELAKISNIVGIKEASGNISQVAEIAAQCGEDFDIYSGNDDQIIPILSLGGKGVISVVANILPKETQAIVDEYQNGNYVYARKLQLQMKSLIDMLFIEVSPIPIKEAMNQLGMKVGRTRMPLTMMSSKNSRLLEEQLKKFREDVMPNVKDSTQWM